MFHRPKPKLETVPLARCVFRPKCQQRGGLPTERPSGSDAAALFAACWRAEPDGEPVCVADPKVARELADALAEGAEFDPLDVVREEQPKGRGRRPDPLYIVFGGFTRGAAYHLHGKLTQIRCNVYPATDAGALQDAIFYSLSENYKNAQARGDGSVRRAVETLLASAAMLDRAREQAKQYGGLGKAIAGACRCSYSLVTKVLKEQGKSIQGTKLIDRECENSNVGNTFATRGKGQVTVQVSAAGCSGAAAVPELEPPPALAPTSAPEPPADTIPTAEPQASPASDAPAEVTAPTPDLIAGDHLADAKPLFAPSRALADQAIRDLRAAQVSLHNLLVHHKAGHLLRLLTKNGNPIFAERPVKSKTPTGSRTRLEWGNSILDAITNTLLRARPKALCAACHGEGCAACKAGGFATADPALLAHSAQAEFDFGMPWDGD